MLCAACSFPILSVFWNDYFHQLTFCCCQLSLAEIQFHKTTMVKMMEKQFKMQKKLLTSMHFHLLNSQIWNNNFCFFQCNNEMEIAADVNEKNVTNSSWKTEMTPWNHKLFNNVLLSCFRFPHSNVCPIDAKKWNKIIFCFTWQWKICDQCLFWSGLVWSDLFQISSSFSSERSCLKPNFHHFFFALN